nr:hypothetical protein [Tanacetum cinerariifolium]
MLVHDPFINSNVCPARSSGVNVSTLSRFIINLEKSKGASRSSLKEERESDCFASSFAKADSLIDACRDLDPVVNLPALLVAVSNEALADSGSLPYLHLLDPRGDVMMMMIRMKDPPLDQTGGLRDEDKASISESAFAKEPVQTTSQIEEPLHPVFETDRDWNKTLPAVQGSTQTWISKLAKQSDSRSSFNELLDAPLDFSNFIMNLLRVDTLTPELLAGPTFELMKGSCTSMIELEYHLEEVYKATTDQLDWGNPEGQQYLHNLLQPLPLIPNNRGRRIIPFAHFINNDLEYLRGGVESIFAIASSSVAPLPTPTPTMTPSTITTIMIATQAPIPPTPIPIKDQVSRILPRIKQSVNAQLESEVLTRSSHSSRTSYAVAANLSEMKLKKILIEKMEGNKSIQEGWEPESAHAPLEPATRSAGRSTTRSKSRLASVSESAFAEEPVQTISQIEEPSHPVFETSAEDQPIVQSSQHPEWFPLSKKPPTLDRDWNKTLPAVQGSAQTWISELAKQADSRSSFNGLLDTPIDFSNFIINRLGVDTLTPELLAGPTYELMRGSCNSLTELEYHLEEVYKATTDQLDWVNPKGQQYPHNLLQPLPLIPDNRGRRVIPFAHFINNDLEYLRGVPQAENIQHLRQRQRLQITGISSGLKTSCLFYGFTVNRESARDVYSKRRITAVTDLKIVKWHNYKHLDWISIRRDDDKIYKFKEGDFKRLSL